MQDFEVPAWVKVKKSDIEVDITKEYGAGKRIRKDVMYDDKITDSEFTKLVEAGELQDEIQKRKKNRDEEEKEEESASRSSRRRKLE